jgi:hypothetical protein
MPAMPVRRSISPSDDVPREQQDAEHVLHSRLQSVSKDELVALIERLATDSDELAQRIDYLTDPVSAVKTLQRQITSIRNGRTFVDYRGSHELAREIGKIATDIEADVLPRDPSAALSLAEKLLALDQKIFDRADDSGGSIGQELRDVCVLWLKCAAAVRAASASPETDWVNAMYALQQANDHGVREPLLSEAHLLLTEPELRALAAQFERDTREMLERSREGDENFHRVFFPSASMGLVAKALRDPALYERSIRIHSPEPNELQSEDIAKCYLDCGDAAGALRWIEKPWEHRFEHQRLTLLDRAYELLGDRTRMIEVRREQYRRAPSVHTFLELERALDSDEQIAFRAQACADARAHRSVATGAEMLFALGESAGAEQLIVERASEIDGAYYGSLTELVDKAKAAGRVLAAALLLRALLDAILARAYAKAYGHGARYLHELRSLAAQVSDYCGHPTHAEYEAAVRARHARKASFWDRVEGRR